MVRDNATQIADQIYNYEQNPNQDKLRSHINDLLTNPQNTSEKNLQSQVDAELEQNNMYPRLVLAEFDHLDTNSDQSVNFAETVAGQASADPLTRMAADFAAQDKNLGNGWTTGTFTRGDAYNYAVQNDPAFPSADEHNVPFSKTYRKGGHAESGPDKGSCGPGGLIMTSPYKDDPMHVLQNHAARPEERLRAIESLVARGTKETMMFDGNGNDMKVRFAVEPVSAGSNKNYVHMYTTDASGHEQIALRAISDGGNIMKQRNSKGQEVEFSSDWWASRHHYKP